MPCKKTTHKIHPGETFPHAPPTLPVIDVLELKPACLADMRRAGITASGPQTAALNPTDLFPLAQLRWPSATPPGINLHALGREEMPGVGKRGPKAKAGNAPTAGGEGERRWLAQ